MRVVIKQRLYSHFSILTPMIYARHKLDKIFRNLLGIGFSILILGGCNLFQSIPNDTDNLRVWHRNDRPNPKRLMVFVHGFDSDVYSAWGDFPTLISDDTDFDKYDILLYGYPTQRCLQGTDIRHAGEGLGSYLKEILPEYHSTVLIGHSMGGLVTLQALLELERIANSLLQDADINILTFGTPFGGVTEANMAYILCGNKQAGDMRALGLEGGRLKKDFAETFNKEPDEKGGNSPQVHLYSFYGTEDNFIEFASACGGPSVSCEQVGGDHSSMVKPSSRDHLSYRKLKSRLGAKKPQATFEDKIGIWVARIRGDDRSHQAQRSLIRNLESHCLNEETGLRSYLEVRELPAEVEGTTQEEIENVAREFSKDYNASILIWGELGGYFRKSELHLRVMPFGNLNFSTYPAYLEPILDTPQTPKVSPPSGTINMPPQLIREPLQLAHFLVALVLMERGKWAEASLHLDRYIVAGFSQTIDSRDVGTIYAYAGLSHFQDFRATGRDAALCNAHLDFKKAEEAYRDKEKLEKYADIQNNLGVTFQILASRGNEPVENLNHSLTALNAAAEIHLGLKDLKKYAKAKNNIGLAYQLLALLNEHQSKQRINIENSITALTESVNTYKGQDNLEGYVREYGDALNNLGIAYMMLGERAIETGKNLDISIENINNSVKEYNRWKFEARVGIAQNNLGIAYRLLAEQNIDPINNLKLSIAALDLALKYLPEMNYPQWHAAVQDSRGVTYRILAESGINPEINLSLSINALQKAADMVKQQGNLQAYREIQQNLGHSFKALAVLNVNKEFNLRNADEAFLKAKNIDTKPPTLLYLSCIHAT